MGVSVSPFAADTYYSTGEVLLICRSSLPVSLEYVECSIRSRACSLVHQQGLAIRNNITLTAGYIQAR
jgi:hypothetical protein